MANNQLLASDDFASGSLAAGWSALPGFSECKVVSGSPNITEGNTTGTTAGQIWTGLTWPNDHASEITIETLTDTDANGIGLITRCQSGVELNCYVASISGTGSSWSVSVFKAVNGSLTQLGSSVGVTVSSGDIFSFQAAGSSLVVYQNSSRVYYYFDVTFTGGSPGYDQNAASSLSNSQVSSWRGYSAVQQDGIWQKQGVVIAPIEVDLDQDTAGVGIQAWNIFLDTNPQILTQYSQVYKMWLVSDWSNDSASSMWAAESFDGRNWTRSESAVLSGVTNGFVIKNGSTYYLYGQASGSSGSGDMLVYTSSNGINWTQQSPTDVLKIGTDDAWDSGSFYNIIAAAIVDGTWYGFYNGANSSPFSTGLATSSDGINWVKYSENPVISNFLPSNSLAQVGGVWYMWCTHNQPGQGGTVLDPFEVARFQSSNLISWEFSSNSLHHSQMFESLNALTGGVEIFALLNVGSETYAYTNSSSGDASSPQVGQIGLAIAPAPIENLVQFAETAIEQTATDNFTSGTGNLDSNWTIPSGETKLQIVNGPYVEASETDAVCTQFFSGTSFQGQQFSSVTLESSSNNNYIYVTVCQQNSGFSCYAFQITGPLGSESNNDCCIQKYIDGVATQLGPFASWTPNQGDVVTLSVMAGSDGSNILSVFQNGYLILQTQDYEAAFSSGSPGIAIYATTLADAQISEWAGGNANVIPNYIIATNLTYGTLLGLFAGNTFAEAFDNLLGWDILQVVGQGGAVIWNLNAQGVATFNPSDPTPDAILGKYFGNTFAQAFLNPYSLDILQIVSPGLAPVFNLNSQGEAFFW